MTTLRILDCGPLTSIQDFGRPGLARLGLPRSGAMDRRALAVANALVGNPPGEAAIELTLLGGRMRADGGPLRVAVTGAEAELRIDGTRVPSHTSLVLAEGSTLTIGPARRGVFMVLAVAGGFEIDQVLASRSLYRRAGIGGLDGRGIRAGDAIALRSPMLPRRMELATDPIEMGGHSSIRIVLGPHADAFTTDALRRLLQSPFTVTTASDRMAYRLDGPPLERADPRDMISQGTLPGGIQVPPDGRPLVLMADCQTVGGYPRIATVASVDLDVLAQRRAGDEVLFEAIGLDEAQRLARQQRAAQLRLRCLAQHAGPAAADAAALDGHRLLRVADAATDALCPASWEHDVR